MLISEIDSSVHIMLTLNTGYIVCLPQRGFIGQHRADALCLNVVRVRFTLKGFHKPRANGSALDNATHLAMRHGNFYFFTKLYVSFGLQFMKPLQGRIENVYHHTQGI